MAEKYRWRTTTITVLEPAPVSSLDEVVRWYHINLQGRNIRTADGTKVYCPPGLGKHLATERDQNTSEECFALGRARKMTRIELTIRHGLVRPMRDKKSKRVIAACFVDQDGTGPEDYMVIARRQGRHLVLNTAFDPRNPDYLERTMAEPREEP